MNDLLFPLLNDSSHSEFSLLNDDLLTKFGSLPAANGDEENGNGNNLRDERNIILKTTVQVKEEEGGRATIMGAVEGVEGLLWQ